MSSPKEIRVNSIEEFQDLIDDRDFVIAQTIVNSILNNLKTKKKNVHVLTVKCLDENVVYDITLEKINFSDTLKENLKYFEEKEMYEQCAKITEAIKVLDKIK